MKNQFVHIQYFLHAFVLFFSEIAKIFHVGLRPSQLQLLIILFWPFTVWINCSCDLKMFANYWPSASNFKKRSRSLKHFFLTVSQNNFCIKIPFLSCKTLAGKKLTIWWWKKKFAKSKKLLTWHKRFFYNEVSSFFSFFFDERQKIWKLL